MNTKKIIGSPVKPMSLLSGLDKKSSPKPLRKLPRQASQAIPGKVNPSGNTKDELRQILCELIIQIAKDAKPHVRVAFTFLFAFGLALLASLLSFEHEPILKTSLVAVFVFLAISFFLDVVEIIIEIPIKELIKEKTLRIFGKK